MKQSATLLAAVALLAVLSCVAYAQNQTGTMPALGSTKGGGSGGSGTTITVTNNSPCEVQVTVNGEEKEIHTNRQKTFNVNTNTVKITVKPEHPNRCSITNWGGFSNTLSQSSASATISSDGSMTVS